jgi:hypothetical protein
MDAIAVVRDEQNLQPARCQLAEVCRAAHIVPVHFSTVALVALVRTGCSISGAAG